MYLILSFDYFVSLAGEEFHTLLGDDYSAHFYGIFKSADVPASSFPIQFVDAANVTAAPLAVGGTSYLFPVDRVLRPPVGKPSYTQYYTAPAEQKCLPKDSKRRPLIPLAQL